MSDIKVLDVDTVNENQLPSIIGNQFTALTELENNVQKAVNLAAKAKKKAADAQVSAGWFKKKVAIELLQTATEGLAEAQISAADAQKISFEYQTKLTEITKFLFGLGVSNLAMNRSVVRELELKLKGASDEEISDLAKQELRNVIMQLKAQEDIMNKQTELSEKVKEHDKELTKRKDKDEEQDSEIKAQAKKDDEHDRLITEQAKKDDKHDRLIAEQAKKDDEHDRLIAENANKISEITAQLTNDLSGLTITVNDNNQKVLNKISTFSEDFNLQVQSLIDRSNKTKSDLSDEINNLADKTNSIIEQLKSDFSDKDIVVKNRLEELQHKIENLNRITSKLAWKIIISIVAVCSLVINILQIFHII